MKVKTNELIGAALDWAVAKGEGYPVSMSKTGFLVFIDPLIQCGPKGSVYSPSTDWNQGGPIIEREIGNLWKHNKLDPSEPDCWTAITYCPGPGGVKIYHKDGPTPLVAAMRCYVAAKLGDEAEVPDELCL